jgi:hypothetical protein
LDTGSNPNSFRRDPVTSVTRTRTFLSRVRFCITHQ